LGKLKASIIKAGHSLSDLQSDTSNFGGYTEILGLRDDLSVLVDKLYLDEAADADVVFIFGSRAAVPDRSSLKDKRVYQIITDLNLIHNGDEIGPHKVLVQIPSSPDYFPAHEYVLHRWAGEYFTSRSWQEKTLKVVYGGAGRKGNRDNFYAEYLVANNNVEGIYSDSSLLADEPSTTSHRIPFPELQLVHTKARYGIVFADPLYNALGMVTQRPLEYMLNGMICVFEATYPHHHFQYDPKPIVATRSDFDDCIDELERQPDKALEILAAQNLYLDQVKRSHNSMSILKNILK
jgi:hypothetical protein